MLRHLTKIQQYVVDKSISETSGYIQRRRLTQKLALFY